MQAPNRCTETYTLHKSLKYSWCREIIGGKLSVRESIHTTNNNVHSLSIYMRHACHASRLRCSAAFQQLTPSWGKHPLQGCSSRFGFNMLSMKLRLARKDSIRLSMRWEGTCRSFELLLCTSKLFFSRMGDALLPHIFAGDDFAKWLVNFY